MTAPDKSGDEKDPYWWTPWAVLIGLLLYGLFGYLGVLSPKQKGPTAADVPVTAATPEPATSVRKKK